MATKSSSLKFSTNLRYAVGSEARLSISHFSTSVGHTYAVALFRKCGSGWELQHETAAEFSGGVKDIKLDDAGFRATDYAAKLVAKVLGECPVRFFRDAAV